MVSADRGKRQWDPARSTPDAVHEKRRAALSSVLAALMLTSLKLIVGFLTGSLGILSEALHSGLDLAAAMITFIAVRVADRPADAHHLYGHGKVENLSALAETLLLLATAVWVIYEAVQRLFFKMVEVDASLWAFGVMALSIVVDVSRSRVLMRAARRHESQALEADALHFSTDIWSSTVVIVGLLGVRLAEVEPRLRFLAHADALAAIGVSSIVILIGARLGQRAIAALMDAAPEGTVEKVRAAVRQVAGVVDCDSVRVRGSGADIFVDVTVKVRGDQPLTAAHAIADQAEEAVRRVLPRADVVVHTEPYVKRQS